MRMLILEDDQKYLFTAVKVAQALGFTEIEPFLELGSASRWLNQCVEGRRPPPDLILLDLDLGYESRYDFLRLWYTTRSKTHAHLIIWSMLGENNREICSLFGVDGYVPKWEGEEALRKVLNSVRFQ